MIREPTEHVEPEPVAERRDPEELGEPVDQLLVIKARSSGRFTIRADALRCGAGEPVLPQHVEISPIARSRAEGSSSSSGRVMAVTAQDSASSPARFLRRSTSTLILPGRRACVGGSACGEVVA